MSSLRIAIVELAQGIHRFVKEFEAWGILIAAGGLVFAYFDSSRDDRVMRIIMEQNDASKYEKYMFEVEHGVASVREKREFLKFIFEYPKDIVGRTIEIVDLYEADIFDINFYDNQVDGFYMYNSAMRDSNFSFMSSTYVEIVDSRLVGTRLRLPLFELSQAEGRRSSKRLRLRYTDISDAKIVFGAILPGATGTILPGSTGTGQPRMAKSNPILGAELFGNWYVAGREPEIFLNGGYSSLQEIGTVEFLAIPERVISEASGRCDGGGRSYLFCVLGISGEEFGAWGTELEFYDLAKEKLIAKGGRVLLLHEMVFGWTD